MDLDPYDVLEIPWNASEDAIKRAFRSLALRYHPDRNRGNRTSEERLKLITAAYHRLKDSGWSLPRRPARPSHAGPTTTWHEDVSPQFWADGAPIHYPTPEELESLIHDVSGIKRRQQARAHAQWVGIVLARIAVYGLAALLLTWVFTIVYSVGVDLWRGS